MIIADMDIVFTHGADLVFFRKYYQSIFGEIGKTELEIIKENPDHLITLQSDDVILGHCIWHESNTRSHPNGTHRDDKDRKILEEELGVEGHFIELHEVWLKEDKRGRGLGKLFFDYFEDMVKSRDYRFIVYYADHPAALKICRNRGYKESYGVELDGITGDGGVFQVFAKEFC